MAKYVPRVLICGNLEDFKKIIGDKPAEVVGQINFAEKNLTGEDLRQMLDGAAEYLIFTDDIEFYHYLENFPLNWQVMSATAFAKKIHGGFFSNKMLATFNQVLNQKKFSHVLDFKAISIHAVICRRRLIASAIIFIRLWKMFTGKFIGLSTSANFIFSTRLF